METFQERRAIPRTNRLSLVRIPDVVVLCGLSRSSIYAAIKTRNFPKPIAVGGRARAWIRHEVEDWIGKRIRASRDAANNGADAGAATSPAAAKTPGGAKSKIRNTRAS